MSDETETEKKLRDLEKLIEQGGGSLTDETEMKQVAKEFTENKPSSSNLTADEFILTWRAKSILRKLSPKSVRIIEDYVDGKRSVQGWNTEKKVEAITGIQKQRMGMMERMFAQRPQG